MEAAKEVKMKQKICIIIDVIYGGYASILSFLKSKNQISKDKICWQVVQVSARSKHSHTTTETRVKHQLGHVFQQKQLQVLGVRDHVLVSAVLSCMASGA